MVETRLYAEQPEARATLSAAPIGDVKVGPVTDSSETFRRVSAGSDASIVHHDNETPVRISPVVLQMRVNRERPQRHEAPSTVQGMQARSCNRSRHS